MDFITREAWGARPPRAATPASHALHNTPPAADTAPPSPARDLIDAPPVGACPATPGAPRPAPVDQYAQIDGTTEAAAVAADDQ